MTKGADQIGSYHKLPQSERKWCKQCGGHLFTDHPGWSLVDIYAAVIPIEADRLGLVRDEVELPVDQDVLPERAGDRARCGGEAHAASSGPA